MKNIQLFAAVAPTLLGDRMKGFKNKTVVLSLIVSVILIIIDQITKVWALDVLKPEGTIEFIPGFLQFTYVENRGAAFGMFQQATIPLALVSTIVIAVLIFALLKGYVKSSYLIWTLALIIAGGAGNVIDRFYRGFVVDFLDVQISFLRNFPVFNFADCCVTVGGFMLLIYLLVTELTKNNSKEN